MASNHSRNFSALVISILWFFSTVLLIESLSANSNTSQVNVRTSGVSSEVKDGDLNSEVNVLLGQVWVSDLQQPICIPANSARIVSGKSDGVAQQLVWLKWDPKAICLRGW